MQVINPNQVSSVQGDIYNRYFETEQRVYVDHFSGLTTDNISIDGSKKDVWLDSAATIKSIRGKSTSDRWKLIVNTSDSSGNPTDSEDLFVPSSMRKKVRDLVFETLKFDEAYFKTMLEQFKTFLSTVNSELNQNEAFKKRFGTQVAGEVADEDALLRGSMVELAEDGTAKEDGIKVERTIVSPKYLKDDDEKAKFVGKKVGDELVFNPGKGAGGNVTELAAMLNIDKDQAADVKSDFNFKVEEILVNKDAEMGQELFDSVLGKDVVKTEKEYFEKVKEMLAGQLKIDSNYRFTLDAEQVLKKKVGDLEMPDEFLKRYLVSINKDADQAKIEEEYPRTREEIVWQLIKEKVARTYDVKIEQDDLMRLARIYASQQFAQYGMGNLPDDMLDRYAGELLENKDYSREISRRAFEDKVFATIRDNVSLNEKTVTVEEFNKLFEKDKK